MRFTPSLLDEIRARLPVSQVVARKVALKRAGREMKGLSPFKQERTPSFFVNDHKGSWFDFSSGQNGDIFKFVMLTEGLSFPEAVERLAEEAGLPGFHMTLWNGLWVPKGTPKDIVARLNAAVVEAMADPAVQKRLTDLGLELPARDQQTPQALAAWHKAEVDKWWPIIKKAGIKPE